MKSISTLLCLGWCVLSFAQNIGINTPTPNAALDVRSTGSTSATYGVLVSNNTNDTSLVVSDNGNVGIGTTLPAYTLDVQSSNPIAARFSGRVTGQNAVNANEFITLQQAGTLSANNSGSYFSTPTMWSTLSTSAVVYYNALLYCRNLTEGGFTDWHVPSIEEFTFLISTDNIPVPSFVNGRAYWIYGSGDYSNTSYWYVNTFQFSNTSPYFQPQATINSNFVICVR